MRFTTILFLSFLISFSAFAKTQEANVNVILEIEGEYKFEPFKPESLGLKGLVDTGTLRVVTESDPGLPKYAALNEARQKARNEVWAVIVNSYLADDMTVKDAVLNSPPYYEYKEKDSEKDKLAAMTKSARDAYYKEHGKEKKYDFDKVLETIKECGSYKNSGRFYDTVEKKGYSCLEVSLSDFMKSVENDKINIFKDLPAGEKYRPVDTVENVKYDGIIIDAADTEYVPEFMVKVLSPTEETVYSGIAGRKQIYFANDMDEAKSILAPLGAKRVYNAKAIGVTGHTGLRVSLPSADRIYSTVSKDSTTPFVIIYKDNTAAAGE